MKSSTHSFEVQDPEQLWPSRNCEVCRSSQARLLFRQRFASMSEGSIVTGYNVVSCETCGFCYADHLPGQEVFDTYYREMSKYEQPVGPVKPSQFDVDRFEFTVGLLKPHMVDPGARILEIGCASGLLLSLLKGAGYRKVEGLDPSPACCQAADQAYGIRVRCGALSDELIPKGSVDLLVLIGVMEHIRDLGSALPSMVRMLSHAGRVFITVPDASKYATGDDAPYQEFSLEHINYFGRESLTSLMAVHGFRCLFVRQDTQRVNLKTVTPVVHALFERVEGSSSLPLWKKDVETVQGLESYVHKSSNENSAVQPVLDELVRSKLPVIIWGAGSHTLRLLATSRLQQAKLIAIVDSNPRYQGKSVGGIQIVSPESIRQMPGKILISSRVFQDSIRQQIQERMGLPHEVITLY